MLVETYEKQNFPIEAPDPVNFLNYIMESRGLTRKDLEPYIGPRGRVSDILNRVRPLTLEMIRRLFGRLGFAAKCTDSGTIQRAVLLRRDALTSLLRLPRRCKY